MSKRQTPPLSNLLLAFGVLFLILGAGNTLFGHIRATYYKDLLVAFRSADGLVSDSARNTEAQEPALEPAPFESTIPEIVLSERAETTPEDRAQLERLESRHAFYRFCILGGKSLLALSGMLLLLGLLLRRGQSRESELAIFSLNER